jgi:Asp-tRNA(Asn)/Glu-tRNA(Gln) amidotransferase A subunit family amidase
LQIAGRHFKDEETLAAAKIVEEIIKGGGKISKL